MTGKKKEVCCKAYNSVAVRDGATQTGGEFRLVLDQVKMCCVDTHNNSSSRKVQ